MGDLIWNVRVRTGSPVYQLDYFIHLKQDLRYWVDDGCHSETGGNSDDFVGRWISGRTDMGNTEYHSARCCNDNNNVCVTPASCPQGLTYDEAVNSCAQHGLRLCTKTE